MIMDREKTIMITKVIENVYRKLPKKGSNRGWSKKRSTDNETLIPTRTPGRCIKRILRHPLPKGWSIAS